MIFFDANYRNLEKLTILYNFKSECHNIFFFLMFIYLNYFFLDIYIGIILIDNLLNF
jgi:hypothetical protein